MAGSLRAASGIPQVARGNPLSATLAHCYRANAGGPFGLSDIAGRAPAGFGSGTSGNPSGNSLRVDAVGPYINFDDSGTGIVSSVRMTIGDATGSGSPGANAFSFLERLWLPSYGYNNGNNTVTVLYGGNNSGIEIRINSAGKIELLKQGIALMGTSSGVVPLTAPYFDVGVAYDGVSMVTFFINGLFAGTATSTQTFVHSGQYTLGYAATSGTPERMPNGSRVYACDIHNRALSAGQFKSWSDNPNQVLEAANDNDYGGRAADTTLSGGAGATSSGAGALTTSIRLSGAAQAAASAGGALTTAISLAGTAASTASAFGTLAGGAAALSGAATAAGSASGALSTAIPLAGTAVSQASASGTMAGAGAALAGSAAAVASGAGALSTSISLSGAAGAQASAAAALTTKVALAGAGAAQAVATGALSADASMPSIDISQISPAHIVVFEGSGSRIVVFEGSGSRLRIDQMDVSIKLPTKVGDKWMVDRDPDEISWYGADITQELIDRATTPLDQAKVIPVLAGVAMLQGPFIQTASVGGVTRTYIVVLLGGVDGTLPDDWHWLARVPCANGERFDKTTYFNKVNT